MRLRIAGIVAISILLSGPTWGDSHPTFQSLWAEATRNADCAPASYPDFILVTCKAELTLWYFTKPNHPAHPGVIKRTITQKDGAFFAEEEGTSFASDAAQPAFRAWLAQIRDLDRQMREYQQQKTNPSQNSN